MGRLKFLSLLTQEFKKSNSHEAKKQVLANLSNFAYDPINYDFIRQLEVIDLFLQQLSQPIEEFTHYALAGLCNLSPDPKNAEYIVRKNGVFLISQLLLHKNLEISLNALSTLIFLINNETQTLITTPEIINKVLHYQTSPNTRLRNLGTIFIQDYCTSEQINYAKNAGSLETVDIPLPT